MFMLEGGIRDWDCANSTISHPSYPSQLKYDI